MAFFAGGLEVLKAYLTQLRNDERQPGGLTDGN